MSDLLSVLNLSPRIAVLSEKREMRRKELILAFVGMCPYIKDMRSLKKNICECATFTFPDRKARRDIVYKYCAHPDNWMECPLKKAMDGFYDRKHSGAPIEALCTEEDGEESGNPEINNENDENDENDENVSPEPQINENRRKRSRAC